MANWESITNNRVTIERVRSLCLAMITLRRRREAGEEERRLGVILFWGRGIVPVEPVVHQERVPGRNGNVNMARGRSRSYPESPPNIFRSQPHSQPCCLTAGLGYVASNAHFPSRINPPSCHASNSPCPCQHCCPCHFQFPTPLSQNQNDTESISSESSDSEDGDSLKRKLWHPINNHFSFKIFIFIILIYSI